MKRRCNAKAGSSEGKVRAATNFSSATKNDSLPDQVGNESEPETEPAFAGSGDPRTTGKAQPSAANCSLPGGVSRPSIRFCSTQEVDGDVGATAEWIWNGLVARQAITLLTAQWKSGKTTLLSVLLAKMGSERAALLRTQLGYKPESAGVLTAEIAEDAESQKRRLCGDSERADPADLGGMKESLEAGKAEAGDEEHGRTSRQSRQSEGAALRCTRLLAGREVAAERAAVISEESSLHWRGRIQSLGIGEHVSWLCRPFPGLPTPEEWSGLIDATIDLHARRGLDLVVIDPLAAFLPDGGGGDARGAMNLIGSLRLLCDLGMGC